MENRDGGIELFQLLVQEILKTSSLHWTRKLQIYQSL